MSIVAVEFGLLITADKVPDTLRIAERLARMMVGYALDGMHCELTVVRVSDEENADSDVDADAHDG